MLYHFYLCGHAQAGINGFINTSYWTKNPVVICILIYGAGKRERKSRFSLIYKVEQKTSNQGTKAISKLLLLIKHNVYTVTSDNGKEFAGHNVIANDLDADFYFAHPYSSFERGLNENTNGLIRQCFPKDRDFTTITDQEIIRTIKKLNNQPRKCLGFKTPNQAFWGSVNCCT